MRVIICVLGWLSAISGVYAAETIRIRVDKLAFSPARASAHVGDTLEWVNSDFIAHTATSRGQDWDVALPANGSGKVVLGQPGEIHYYCRFHPNMSGRVTITP